jgi:hypothetical protein
MYVTIHIDLGSDALSIPEKLMMTASLIKEESGEGTTP